MDDELYDLLASTVVPLGLELVDVQRQSATIRVVVDRAGGIDLDGLADATRTLSGVLDAHDPFPGHRYTLEVSSPGVERRLRTPRHFARAVGEVVTVRTLAGAEGERRVTGCLVLADDEGFVLDGDEVPGGSRRLAYDEVERARTVFEWGPGATRGARGGPLSRAQAGRRARPSRRGGSGRPSAHEVVAP